ncbi:MAG: rRNA pseudouridine synthase [Phycisphaeraceae bacterium]|nr:MAG: rRNA pseudouridine synthase [Phycisphaeraceae bacterium]
MPRRTPSELPLNDPSRGERLQRVLAEAGVGARRVCEALIEAGHVRVNDEVVRRLPVFVDPQQDRIEVQGRPLAKPAGAVYIMLHKPARTLTAPGERVDDDRPRAVDLIDHPLRPRLFPVGGMDFDASGLMVYTNDGAVVNRLTHPRYGVERVYVVKVGGAMDAKKAGLLAKGVFVYVDEPGTPGEGRGGSGGGSGGGGGAGRGGESRGKEGPRFVKGKREGARKIKLEVSPEGPDPSEVRVVVRQGRDAEIAKALAVVGCPPKRMKRVAFGPIELKGLGAGRWRELERPEVKALRALTKAKRESGEGRPVAGRAGSGTSSSPGVGLSRGTIVPGGGEARGRVPAIRPPERDGVKAAPRAAGGAKGGSGAGGADRPRVKPRVIG